MSTIKSANDLPEVSFIGNVSLEELRAQMISDYCTKYKELTGRNQEKLRLLVEAMMRYSR